MLRYSILAILIIILPLFACSTVKTGKDIAIDSPLKKSRKNQSLSEARQEVEKSRRQLDNCLERYSGDESKCTREKENYDQDVEEYANIQAS
ncbi:MAG: hypothetical protein AAF462_01970 [Thermodesulfobacteriota bacterium]